MNAQSRLQTNDTLHRSAAARTSGILQRKCDCGNHTVAGGKCDECQNKTGVLQRKSSNNFENSEVPPIVHEVLSSSGRPLDESTRAFFEPRFAHNFSRVPVSSASRQMSRSGLTVGEPADVYEREADRVADSVMQKPEHKTTNEGAKLDLSGVRIHTDARAAESARAVNALAYTVGNNIVFGAGQFAVSTREGRRLLAHELTHVAQQSAKSFSAMPIIQRQPAAAAAPVPVNGGLTEEMLKQIARELYQAMKGLGTDEEAIYSAFSGRTQEQVDAMARVYKEMYKVSLFDELRDELTDSEMEHLETFSPVSMPGKPGSAEQGTAQADKIALQINKAIKGPGTDEESIYAALIGRTQDELKAIKEAYSRLTNRYLGDDIRGDMEGAELYYTLSLLNQGMMEPEDELHRAMEGAGTDEETLLRVLNTVKGDRAKITDLIDKFAKKGYGNLLEEVNAELSGDDLDTALEALHGQTPSAACSVKERDEALEAISLAAAMAQNANNRANTDLVSNKLSNSVKNALEKYFNPGAAPNAINLQLLRKVRDAFDQIRSDILSFSDVTCVTANDGHCVVKPDCSQYVSAWTMPSAGNRVHICPAFYICDSSKSITMLHEFFHHMGILDRKIYYGQPGYASLTPIGDGSTNDSLSKADAYAHFAKELF